MKMDDKLYAVIIGDVAGSKRLSSRNRYQTQLFMKSAIVQINEEFADHIEAPFTITKGDEFQGLITNLEVAFKVVMALEKLTFPVKLRFGIGVGNIYRMGGILPIEMDGPAFHRANYALNDAKKKKQDYFLHSNEETLDILANTVFHLMTAIKLRWNERHYRLFWRYKDLGTYRQVAELENVTPQAICEALKNTRALYVKSAEENLLEYFRKFPVCTAHFSEEALEENELS